MFRKLVSSLPFSPALVGQLGFYARRLSKEQATRQLGLVFTVLAITVQSLTLLSPPEPTYASSPTVECRYSSALTTNDSECRPCPYNANVWINDPSCNKDLSLSVEAVNLSRSGKSVIGSIVDPNDRIQYTVKTTNNGPSKANSTIEVSVADLLEYATMNDPGGGTFDRDAQKITWGSVTLDSKQTDVRSFMMAVNSTLPITPQAVDSTSSYNCIISITYGNTLDNTVNCPIGKEVEGVIKQLPEAGPNENILFSTFLLMTVTYFYIRSRQVNREMKIIRRDFNVG
jgi:uncharacterized repeat protein (TIGR01451 family)